MHRVTEKETLTYNSLLECEFNRDALVFFSARIAPTPLFSCSQFRSGVSIIVGLMALIWVTRPPCEALYVIYA